MLAFLLNSKGVLYVLNMYYAKSLVFFTEAFKLYSEIGNNTKALAIYSNIGAAYGRSGKNQEALNHYKRADQILKLDLENAGYARMVFYLGYATELYDNDMDDEGERIVKVLYSETRGRKDMYSVRAFIECHSKITDVLVEKGEYELALIEMQKGLEYATEFKEICSTHGLYKSAANYYRELNEYDKAIEYLAIAKEIILKRKNSLTFSDVLLKVAEVYEESGQYKKAFNAFDIYHKTKTNFEKRLGEILIRQCWLILNLNLTRKIMKHLKS